MKRLPIIISTVALLIGLAPLRLSAQNAYTAFSLADYQREGTARSVAMGNAFTALGADMGAIAINPAASAVYKFNEFSFTPALNGFNTKTDYLGVKTPYNQNSLGFANVGGVINIPSASRGALKSYSFSFVYNKFNNFNHSIKAEAAGVDDSYLRHLAGITNDLGDALEIEGYDLDKNAHQNPFWLGGALWVPILAWNTSLLDTLGNSYTFYPTADCDASAYRSFQQLTRTSAGSIGEYDVNFGMNLNDNFYIGLNLGLFTMWNKIKETYSEDNETPGLHDFNYLDQTYSLTTAGNGINLKLGFIFAPIQNIRIGASISTPTWYSLTDKYWWSMNSNFEGYNAKVDSPDGTFDYKIKTPMQYSVGVAAVFPMGTISVDYEGSNLSQAKISNRNGNEIGRDGDFSYDNNLIKDSFGASHQIRVGAEINPIREFSIRGGFQYKKSGIDKSRSTSITKAVVGNALENYVASVGLGYNSGTFFADLACAMNVKKSKVPFFDFSDYAAEYVLSNPKFTTIERSNWKVLVTLGWRF